MICPIKYIGYDDVAIDPISATFRRINRRLIQSVFKRNQLLFVALVPAYCQYALCLCNNPSLNKHIQFSLTLFADVISQEAAALLWADH
jgi:hypothetical protein